MLPEEDISGGQHEMPEHMREGGQKQIPEGG